MDNRCIRLSSLYTICPRISSSFLYFSVYAVSCLVFVSLSFNFFSAVAVKILLNTSVCFDVPLKCGTTIILGLKAFNTVPPFPLISAEFFRLAVDGLRVALLRLAFLRAFDSFVMLLFGADKIIYVIAFHDLLVCADNA